MSRVFSVFLPHRVSFSPSGMRRKPLFSSGVFLLLAIAALSQSSKAQGHCIAPHNVVVPQVRGQVFDAFGIAVPFATVTVLGIDGAVRSTADDTGRFSFNVPVGHYVFKAEGEGFSNSIAELNVGRSWQTIFGHRSLKVMLGFGDLYCPWVTTSKVKFEQIADANMAKLKESAQILNASENDGGAANGSASSGETAPTKEISENKKKTAPLKATPQTKETSETHATQK